MGSAVASDPARIGPYIVLGRIAIGGMAEVFEARRAADEDDDPPRIVIKRMLPEHARDPELVRAFAHEAELAEKLVHPCLVRVIEHGEDGNEPYLVMERVDGLSLAALLDHLRDVGRALEPKLAIFVVRAVLEALAYAHEAKDDDGVGLEVVHRDVTPHNVLLSLDGAVKLSDFGIARSSLRAARTRTGVIKGKLLYLAPEQVTGSDVDARTDLYALGVVLFELLTGERYFTGDTELEIMRKAEAPTPRRPSELATGIDAALDRVVLRAVMRFPEERWPSARAMMSGLDQAAGEPLDRDACARALRSLVREARDAGHGPRVFPEGSRTGASADDASRFAGVTSAKRAAPRSGAWRRGALALGVLAAVVASVFAVYGGLGGLGGTGAPEGDVGERGVGLGGGEDAGAGARRDGGDERHRASVRGEVPDSGAAVEATPVGPEAIDHGRQPNVRPVGRVVDAGRLAGSMAEAATTASDADARAALARRIDGLLSELGARGLRESDLPPELRGSLAEARAATQPNGDLQRGESAFTRTEAAVRALRIDAAFVRAKLERTNRAIGAASDSGVDTARLEALSAAALQDLMAGRNEATNERLNAILDLLPRRAP